MKLIEQPSKDEDTIIHAHQHVDNGGYTVIIDRYGSMTIEFGFHGYSNTSICMSMVDLLGFENIIKEARVRLERQAIVDKLS